MAPSGSSSRAPSRHGLPARASSGGGCGLSPAAPLAAATLKQTHGAKAALTRSAPKRRPVVLPGLGARPAKHPLPKSRIVCGGNVVDLFGEGGLEPNSFRLELVGHR